MTLTEYMHYQPPPGFRDELIEGEVLLSPSANPLHGEICHRLVRLIEACLVPGYVVRQDTTMCLDEEETQGNRPRPDVFVIDEDRWSVATASKEYPSGSAQLPIEVLSPSTERVDRQTKTPKYLAAGALAVWLVDPDRRSLTVVDANGSVTFQSGQAVYLPPALGSGPIHIGDMFPKPRG